MKAALYFIKAPAPVYIRSISSLLTRTDGLDKLLSESSCTRPRPRPRSGPGPIYFAKKRKAKVSRLTTRKAKTRKVKIRKRKVKRKNKGRELFLLFYGNNCNHNIQIDN